MEQASANDRGRHRLLLLARHGKAAPKDVGLTDFETILTEAGTEECEKVAAEANAMKLSVDLMLSSPADRALETAHLFARRLAYPVQKIQIAEILYTAGSIRPLVAHIRHLDSRAHTVAIFGHNPLLEDLVTHFVIGFSQNLPKGAVAGIEFETASWADVAKGRGQLLFFLTPQGRDI